MRLHVAIYSTIIAWTKIHLSKYSWSFLFLFAGCYHAWCDCVACCVPQMCQPDDPFHTRAAEKVRVFVPAFVNIQPFFHNCLYLLTVSMQPLQCKLTQTPDLIPLHFSDLKPLVCGCSVSVQFFWAAFLTIVMHPYSANIACQKRVRAQTLLLFHFTLQVT